MQIYIKNMRFSTLAAINFVHLCEQTVFLQIVCHECSQLIVIKRFKIV